MGELRSWFLKKGLAPITMVFCLLGLFAMALDGRPAEQGASETTDEAVEESSETAPAVSEAKGTLRNHPITHRLGKARADRGNLKLVYGQLSAAEHKELEQIFREERFSRTSSTG